MMQLPNVGRAVAYLGMAASKHLPAILTGFTVGGVILTTASAIFATVKLKDHLNLTGERVREMKVDEAIKTVAPYYIPTVLLAGGTIVCAVASHKTSARRLAAVAGLYEASSELAKRYETEADHILEPEKARELKEAVQDVSYDGEAKIPCRSNNDGIPIVQCVDSLGREFECDILTLGRGEVVVSSFVVDNWRCCLNDWYEAIGLEPTDIGYDLIWDRDHPFVLNLNRSKVVGGVPKLYIDYGQFNVLHP